MIDVRSRRRAVSASVFTTVLLTVALSGCGGRLDRATPSGSAPKPSVSSAPQAAGDATSGSTPASGGLDPQTAAQIEGAVKDAQSTLDDLDKDFAGDDAAAG